jgi:hypothetical protein
MGYYPPAMGYHPPMMMPPVMMDSGMPPGLANAFTQGGTTRPIPADFGPTPQRGNAFAPPEAIQMTAMAQAMAQAMVAGQPRPRVVPLPPMPPGAPPAGYVQAPQPAAEKRWLLATLRDSLYPSERELAAERLASADWRAEPEVAQALLAGARSDPAPAVRASCVRALGQMRINTVPVVAGVRALKDDADPRVRHEVQRALAVMQAP